MVGAPVPPAVRAGVGVELGDGVKVEVLDGVGAGDVAVREGRAGGGSAVDRVGSGVARGVRAVGVGAAGGGAVVGRCVGRLVGATGS
ncbi:hypothetical protein [Streptomyces sp. NPDC001135]